MYNCPSSGHYTVNEMAFRLGEKRRTIKMENSRNNTKDYYVIDVVHIFKSIWYRIWVVILAGFIAAGIGFSIAAFAITPTYSSSIMLYVNNSSISLNDVGFSISSSDLTAAQSLVKTYNVLLKNRTTLDRVIEETGITYAWDELYDMIKASSVDETEVMKITVTTIDPNASAPEEAEKMIALKYQEISK